MTHLNLGFDACLDSRPNLANVSVRPSGPCPRQCPGYFFLSTLVCSSMQVPYRLRNKRIKTYNQKLKMMRPITTFAVHRCFFSSPSVSHSSRALGTLSVMIPSRPCRMHHSILMSSLLVQEKVWRSRPCTSRRNFRPLGETRAAWIILKLVCETARK